jgi:choline dehydrogenase-like flavoprotein
MDVIETDVCIVGSGMGGGTLALKLADLGLRPLVIEAGNTDPDMTPVSTNGIGRAFGLDRSHAIEVGGSTNLWHGVVSPLDRRDFADGPGYTGWPIRYETMLPYWHAALEFLGFDNPDITHFDQLEPSIQKLANDIAYDEFWVQPKLFRVMGRPRRLKDSLLFALAAGRLDLIQNAVALELVADSSSTHAHQLIVGQGSVRRIIKARSYVICAGALATPRLLQNSKTFGLNGLGNANGNVGKYLMDHPMAFLGKIRFKYPKRAPLFSDMREAHSNRFRIGLVPRNGDGLLNSNLYLRPAIPGATPDVENKILLSLIAIRKATELSPRHVWTLLSYPKVLYRIIANRYVLPIRYKAADLFFVTEQTPTAESRVSLSRDRTDQYGYPLAEVDWHVSESDLGNVGSFIDRLVNDGLKNDSYVFDEIPSLDKWRHSFTSAAHHLGTARMADKQRDGVVDANLRIHGVNNVWICDGSVFPTGGNANPSLTICALAHRLSEHLVEDLKK